MTWKVAVFGPPRALTRPVEWFGTEVAAKTGGQVKIELVYGEALAKAPEVPDGLRAGAFEMALVCASYFPAKLPLFTVFDLPMLAPEDVRAQSRLQLALADHPAVAAEMRRWDMTLLLPAPMPHYQIMSRKRIARAEDLAGLRIRVSGEMARVLEDFGAVKTLVTAPEAYQALERGVVDAVTFPATYAFFSYRIHEVAKYFVDRISLGTQPCFYGVSLTAWQRLTPQVRKLMLDLRPAVIQRFYDGYAAEDAKNYDIFKRQGMEILRFPAAERARLLANVDRHWQAWAADKDRRGLPGTAILQLVHATLKRPGAR